MLLATLQKTRTDKGSRMTFVDVHRSLVELVIDGGKLTQILGCLNNFDTVASELVEVVSKSHLGRQLFQEQLAATVAGDVSQVLLEEVVVFRQVQQ